MNPINIQEGRKRKEPESIKCFSRVRGYLYLPMHIRSIQKFPAVSIPQIVSRGLDCAHKVPHSPARFKHPIKERTASRSDKNKNKWELYTCIH